MLGANDGDRLGSGNRGRRGRRNPAALRRSSPHLLPDWSAARFLWRSRVRVGEQSTRQRASVDRQGEGGARQPCPARSSRELTKLYQDKGLSPQTARVVAEELTANDALAAHLEAELNIDQADIVSPWRAAFASAVAFLIGGLLPILAIIIFPASLRVPATFVTVLIALAITGAAGGYLGDSPMLRPMVRVVLGGALALAATFLIGRLLGTTVLA